jgi:hypothetical protein
MSQAYSFDSNNAKAALSSGFCVRDAPQEYFHFLKRSTAKKIRSPGGTVLTLMGDGAGSGRHTLVAGSIIELGFLRPRCSSSISAPIISALDSPLLHAKLQRWQTENESSLRLEDIPNDNQMYSTYHACRH